MTNILFIGPYRQTDGWGYATRDYIKALLTNKNYNVTTQPLYLGVQDKNFRDHEILQAEERRLDHYDVLVQHALPECFFPNFNFKYNIGMTFLETNNFIDSNFINNMNRMNQIWVPSEQEKNTLIKSGVTCEIKTVSQPIDVSYIESLSDHKLKMNPVLDDMFKFYFIGDYCHRKNLLDLVKAFHLAFSYEERVCLIIKSSKNGLKPNATRQLIEQDIDNVKKSLNISNKYKKEIIITENLSYKDLIGLHNACDCFVMPSYGESFCRPAAEALICGKTPLINMNTGIKDFINESNGFYIKSYATPVISQERTLSNDFDMYTAKETWYQIDINDLIDKLRYIFDMKNSEDLKQKRESGKKTAHQFSYVNIGEKLCI